METILVRINLDIKEQDFQNTLRFHLAASLIKSLSKKNNKLVVLSHAGRPSGREEKLSLRAFAGPLARKSGKEMVFFPKFDFKEIRENIKDAPSGSVFLLENLRFLPGETRASESLAKKLASLGDEFINNDFATAHRNGASITAITRYIPSKAGELLKNEMKVLSRVTKKPKRPFVLIVGGAKIEDKVGVIKYLLPIVDHVLVGGRVGNTFLKAEGVDINDSIYQKSMILKAKRFIKSGKIIIPTDSVIEDGKFLDIGPETQKEYMKIIKTAKTIIWGGPMGYFEKEKFAKGTQVVARAVLANKKADIVVGGAQTVYALLGRATRQERGNIFLSTGGGAMLNFLAGEKLPAIEVLKNK